MRRFTAFVLRLRLPIIIVFSLLTVFFGFWIKDLRVDSDVVSYLPKEEPAVPAVQSPGRGVRREQPRHGRRGSG